MDAPLKLFGSDKTHSSPLDLPNLITLELGKYSFMNAPAIEIESTALEEDS